MVEDVPLVDDACLRIDRVITADAGDSDALGLSGCLSPCTCTRSSSSTTRAAQVLKNFT